MLLPAAHGSIGLIAHGLVSAVVVIASVACAGARGPSDPSPQPAAPARPVTDRFPVPVCRNAVHREATGVWQSASRDYAFVYDGCSVRLVDYLHREPAIFAGLRNVARAFVIDVRDYADPFPYFRTRARWDGERLQSVSILGLRTIATWDGERFWWPYPEPHPYVRVRVAGELGRMARDLVFVERFTPTEAEIAAAAAGVPMPPDDGGPRDYVRDMMQPLRTGRVGDPQPDADRP